MKDKIAELAALEAKATPGPWTNNHASEDHISGSIDCGDKHIALCDYFDIGDESCRVTREEQAANAALIVTMRNALPELLQKLERQEHSLVRQLNRANEEKARADAALARAEKAEAELLEEIQTLAARSKHVDEGATQLAIQKDALVHERNAALARAEKAEADLRDEQRVVAGYRVMLDTAKAERDWLAEQVVDALGTTTRGEYKKPPVLEGYPLCADRSIAVSAWVIAAQEAANCEGGESRKKES